MLVFLCKCIFVCVCECVWCDAVVVMMVGRIWTRAECFAKDKTKREPAQELDGGVDVGVYSGYSSDLLEPRYVGKSRP